MPREPRQIARDSSIPQHAETPVCPTRDLTLNRDPLEPTRTREIPTEPSATLNRNRYCEQASLEGREENGASRHLHQHRGKTARAEHGAEHRALLVEVPRCA